MDAALTLDVIPFPDAIGRSTLWARKIARMTSRLESRWPDTSNSFGDALLDDARLTAASARAQFDDAMLELALQR
jgi:hypothetical protein